MADAGQEPHAFSLFLFQGVLSLGKMRVAYIRASSSMLSSDVPPPPFPLLPSHVLLYSVFFVGVFRAIGSRLPAPAGKRWIKGD